jgi:hypothetical protein
MHSNAGSVLDSTGCLVSECFHNIGSVFFNSQ